MAQGSPSLPTPAAAPAIRAFAGTLLDSEMATSSCPSLAASGRGRGPLIAARVRATSVPACCVAPNHRLSLGVGQSRPMAAASSRGLAAAEFGLSPAAAPNLGPLVARRLAPGR